MRTWGTLGYRMCVSLSRSTKVLLLIIIDLI
jgi:hypothetical protein